MQFENVIIDYNKNKEDIEHWFFLKGELRYEKIISFLKEKNIECTWINVTYYIKYDKRILINSFKYLVFLEEFFKSVIYSENKDAKVMNLEFRKTLDQYLSLDNKCAFDNMNIELLSSKKESLITFRNCVVHNKVLLNRTFKGVNLEEILKIVLEILPHSYREGYIKDINSCAKGITDNLWHIKLYTDGGLIR